MESLQENRALLYSLLGSGSVVFALALGIFPDFAHQFEIVDFPPEVSISKFFIIRPTRSETKWEVYCCYHLVRRTPYTVRRTPYAVHRTL